MTNLSNTDIKNLQMMANLAQPTSNYRGTMSGMQKLVDAGLVRRVVVDGFWRYEITDDGRKAVA
jgi:predicted transcriptional regulator with HTH domain